MTDDRAKKPPFAAVTLGHIRGHGCRDLLVYCGSGWCHHSTTMNADWLPDENFGAVVVSANGLHQVRNDRRGRAAGLVAAHPAGAAASDGKAVVAGRGRPNL